MLNDGTVAPGGLGSAGTMTINGNYTQTATGAYTAELGGVFAGQSDQLAVNGTATLAGALTVTLLPGFVVNLGDLFILMTFNSSTGTFSAVNLPGLATGLQWLLTYNPTDVTLTAASSGATPIPEPGTLLLVASGLGGLLWRRRRSHKQLWT